ncbi:hypothetical protein [Oryzifoliimicrobium ureilyticus]|uniref:hypothetical protein n=1 Tax=Oryzifoliimicrobium ureilyticus TaxID=3113724 RepID=UPI003076325F
MLIIVLIVAAFLAFVLEASWRLLEMLYDHQWVKQELSDHAHIVRASGKLRYAAAAESEWKMNSTFKAASDPN